jgi:hypothetical protein
MFPFGADWWGRYFESIPWTCVTINSAGAMAELADAEDLKSSGGNTLWVRFPLAPQVVDATWQVVPGLRWSMHNVL